MSIWLIPFSLYFFFIEMTSFSSHFLQHRVLFLPLTKEKGHTLAPLPFFAASPDRDFSLLRGRLHKSFFLIGGLELVVPRATHGKMSSEQTFSPSADDTSSFFPLVQVTVPQRSLPPDCSSSSPFCIPGLFAETHAATPRQPAEYRPFFFSTWDPSPASSLCWLP